METPKVRMTLTRPIQARTLTEGPMGVPENAIFGDITLCFRKQVLGGYEADVTENDRAVLFGMKVLNGLDSVPVHTKRHGIMQFSLITGETEDRLQLKFLE